MPYLNGRWVPEGTPGTLRANDPNYSSNALIGGGGGGYPNVGFPTAPPSTDFPIHRPELGPNPWFPAPLGGITTPPVPDFSILPPTGLSRLFGGDVPIEQGITPPNSLPNPGGGSQGGVNPRGLPDENNLPSWWDSVQTPVRPPGSTPPNPRLPQDPRDQLGNSGSRGPAPPGYHWALVPD